MAKPEWDMTLCNFELGERNSGINSDGTSGVQACVFVGVATGFPVGFAGIELRIRLPVHRGRISNCSVHASTTGGRQWYFFVFSY